MGTQEKEVYMSLVRFNSEDYRPTSFSSFIDRFFNDALTSRGVESKFVPQVDIVENDKAFEIHVAVPGMKKNDFHIDINDGRLTISGERKMQNEKNDKNYHSVETYYGSFSRSFYLPDSVNDEKVDARYEDGILYITVPKDEKKLLKRTVTVK